MEKNNQEPPKRTEAERKAWNDALDAVAELMRIHPIHRIGEAAFLFRLSKLRDRK